MQSRVALAWQQAQQLAIEMRACDQGSLAFVDWLLIGSLSVVH